MSKETTPIKVCKMKNMGYHKRKHLKHLLYVRQRKKWCCFCGRYLIIEEATIEHIIPRSAGGCNSLTSLDISCYECNMERGTDNYDDFKKLKCAGAQPIFFQFRKTGRLV